MRKPFSASLGGNDGDLDQQARIGELGLDAGATGKVLFNGELSAGQTKHFTTKKLWINTGTPENLRITVNAKRVAIPGGAPQVFVVTSRGIQSASA